MSGTFKKKKYTEKLEKTFSKKTKDQKFWSYFFTVHFFWKKLSDLKSTYNSGFFDNHINLLYVEEIFSL